jgi:hypothetical protein
MFILYRTYMCVCTMYIIKIIYTRCLGDNVLCVVRSRYIITARVPVYIPYVYDGVYRTLTLFLFFIYSVDDENERRRSVCTCLCANKFIKTLRYDQLTLYYAIIHRYIRRYCLTLFIVYQFNMI